MNNECVQNETYKSLPLWRASICNLRTWSAKDKWLLNVTINNLTRFSRWVSTLDAVVEVLCSLQGCIKHRRPHLVITIFLVLARFIWSLLSLDQLCSSQHGMMGREIISKFYQLISSLKDRRSLTIKGVILTGPGSVWLGLVWFGTVVILIRPVQWTANAFAIRFATKVNRAREQVHFGSIFPPPKWPVLCRVGR